jgi:antitoxin MazE
MIAVAKKWGNSLAIRIPKDIAKTLDISDNCEMEMEIKGKVLTLKPKKQLSLKDLISKINSKNMHKEIDSGISVGHEEW